MSEFKVGDKVRFLQSARFHFSDHAETTKRVLAMGRDVGIIRRANDATQVAMADFDMIQGLSCAYSELEPFINAPADPREAELTRLREQVDALTRERDGLRVALKPFADLWEQFDETASMDTSFAVWLVRVVDLRNLGNDVTRAQKTYYADQWETPASAPGSTESAADGGR